MDLLAQARGNGWDVFPLSDLGSLNEKFDLITLWDVIEHVPDPAAVLTPLVKLLSPKGRIVLETPRFGVLGESFGENWPHLLPLQHLSIASKEGMFRLVERIGLTVDKYCSFGANSPKEKVAEPYKRVYDSLAKKLDFGEVQILSLKPRI